MALLTAAQITEMQQYIESKSESSGTGASARRKRSQSE